MHAISVGLWIENLLTGIGFKTNDRLPLLITSARKRLTTCPLATAWCLKQRSKTTISCQQCPMTTLHNSNHERRCGGWRRRATIVCSVQSLLSPPLPWLLTYRAEHVFGVSAAEERMYCVMPVIQCIARICHLVSCRAELEHSALHCRNRKSMIGF